MWLSVVRNAQRGGGVGNRTRLAWLVRGMLVWSGRRPRLIDRKRTAAPAIGATPRFRHGDTGARRLTAPSHRPTVSPASPFFPFTACVYLIAQEKMRVAMEQADREEHLRVSDTTNTLGRRQEEETHVTKKRI